ncbi:MAG TPA: SusC/RagA family TonB-linked outer membrane protein [Gemmatimonadaceae bacterium]|nr:SusC/RagA family TonB-linked outer membrane protein [Gemmatimonadaceae bacterium]
MPSRVRISTLLARLIAIGAVVAIPLAASAQNGGRIRGRIIDAGSQRPIAGAQVIITGTTLGSATNVNGEYTIANAPEGSHQLVARRIGFVRLTRTVNVASGAETRVDFSLTPSATQLEQVVVTGTGGSAERKTLGNSITTLDVSELTEKTQIMNVSEVLQSRTPGVTILPGSGAPGTAGEIRIRGSSSLSGYKPVVFIDGIRFNIDDLGGFSATGGGTAGLAQSSQVTSALNNLNPNDIESIEVIKGPAAATLYGAEAANGVIQIITKKGTRGAQQMRWSLKAERGRNDYYLLPEDNYTTCDAVKKAQRVSATDTTLVWPGCQTVALNEVIRGNPMRDDPRAIRDGDLSRLSLSIRGGGDKYSYYIGGDRDTEQGVFFNSDNRRTSVRSNFGFSPMEKLNIGVNLNWQDGRIRLPIQDESANGLLLSARRGLPGRISFLGAGNEGWRTISPTSANRYQNYTNSERFTLGATFSYNPFSWFQNRLTTGFDNSVVQAQLLFLPGQIDISQDPDAASGANLRRTPTRRVVTIDYSGTMQWSPRSSMIATTTFGSQVVADKSTLLGATGIGIGAPDVTLINLLQKSTGSESFTENNSVGYYIQEQLGFNERLYLTGAVRADDHSSFGTNFDLIIYPKVSMSYVLSDEPRMKNFLQSARVSSLKLRSAWGAAGRAPSAYSAPQTYTVDRVTLGTVTGSAIRTSSYGNPDLKPERGTEVEAGFDLGLFGDRLGADFTFYDKTTKDMLQSISIAPSTGFISSQLVNLGKVNNRGVELALTGTPIQNSRVNWNMRLNFSTNRNELVSFGTPGKILETPGSQAYGSVQQHRVGYPLGGYWVTPPQRAADGSAILTPTGAAIFNPGDTARRYIGPSTPTAEYGLSNTLTLFKNIRLYALLDRKTGGFIFNLQERNRCQSNDNCARNNDPRARFPVTAEDSILFKEIAVYKSSSISPEWIQKSDFTKLREVSLTYDMPERVTRMIGGRSASVTFSGRNLKIWSDYEGADPEVNTYGGRNFLRVDAYAAPQMRRLSASVNLQY